MKKQDLATKQQPANVAPRPAHHQSYDLLRLQSLKPHPANPRKDFDGPAFEELVASIKAQGVLQPILVREIKGGYQIVAGGRRYRACLALKEETIPAIIRVMTDAEALELMAIENLQREDLSEMEQAEGFKTYLKLRGDKALPDLAERIGVDPRYIRRRMAVLKLPKQVLDLWNKGKLVYGHLEQLLRLQSVKEQQEYAKRTAQRDDSVRELKRDIDNIGIGLRYALFKKTECGTCASSTITTASLFGDDFAGEKLGLCMDTKCFRKHQTAFLKENWAHTQYAKKFKTNTFRWYDELKYDGYHNFYYGPPKKQCATCDKFATLLQLDGKTQYDKVCLGEAGCMKRTEKGAKGSASKAPMAAKSHGLEFRELFYQKAIPQRAAAIPPDDIRMLRLALVALIHADRELANELFGIAWMHTPQAWMKVAAMEREEVLTVLKKASLSVSLEGAFGSDARHIIAPVLGVDLAADWRLHEDYLKRKTIAEILAMGETLGIFKDGKAQTYLTATLKRKSFAACKKSELVDVVLKSGVDLAGKVPEEILTHGVAKSALDEQEFEDK